jgi:transposase
MKTATHALGIDIAKRNFEVNLRTLEQTQGRRGASFTNNLKGFKALGRWLAQSGISQPVLLHACLEATSRYGDNLAAWLYGQGYQVSLINPRRTRHYADSRLTRTVTDRIDATLIADFCAEQRDKLALWEPLPEAHRQLQNLTRARQALVGHREALANLLEAATGLARKSVQRQIANLHREIQRLDQAIKNLLDQPATSHLQSQIALADSIPGVGLLTAAIVVAELPPIDKVSHANQAIALFGLDPKSKTSGDTVKTPARLSKMGSKRGRRALYMPAVVALRSNPLIRALAQRLRAKGCSGKYIVVAAMRKLLRQIFGVIKSGQPFDPQWAQRQTKESERQVKELQEVL